MTSGIIKDIPLLIQSTASSSERRITPTWTITQLKQKLEPITGIPPSAQTLILRLPDQDQEHRIQAEDEDAVQIGKWPLVAYAEIRVRIYLTLVLRSDLSTLLSLYHNPFLFQSLQMRQL